MKGYSSAFSFEKTVSFVFCLVFVLFFICLCTVILFFLKPNLLNGQNGQIVMYRVVVEQSCEKDHVYLILQKWLEKLLIHVA